jgi:hypothetical protein
MTLIGRLYRQRRFDGSLTYPVPVLPNQEIHEVVDALRFVEHTPHGLAIRFLVPENEEANYPFARIATSE